MRGERPESPDRTIQYVRRESTGVIERVADLLGQDYGSAVGLRNAIWDARYDKQVMFTCPSCGSPLWLRHSRDRGLQPRRGDSLHFAHAPNTACHLAQERGWPPEKIDAARYHDQRESQAHKQMKQWVAESVQHDPRFSDVAIEKRWRHGTDPRQWRQPDVSAIHPTGRVAFEVQLSTTFLKVMAARRHFYREQGALLMWIVSEFDPWFSAAAFDDIFYPNNRNLFVVGPHTVAASADHKAFMVEVVYKVTKATDKGLIDHVGREMVSFDQLTQDRVRQRVFYIDVQAENDAALARVKRQSSSSVLRAFLDQEVQTPAGWASVVSQCQRDGIQLPSEWRVVSPLAKTLDRLMGHDGERTWQYKTLSELGHHLYARYPEQMLIFIAAIEALQLGPTISAEAPAHSLREKVAAINRDARDGGRTYLPPLWAVEVAKLLCPEIHGPLERRLRALPRFP
jgi:competence CoiA-like predicted nuclease